MIAAACLSILGLLLVSWSIHDVRRARRAA
jgi:hypothetical protein